LVAAEGLHYSYDSGQAALRGIDLKIGGGEFIALIGQNGSGKTTLAKHLNGLLQPQRGAVRLRGEDIARLPLNRVARDVGYVFQNPDHQIFAASVFDEVAFGPRNLDCSAAEVEERVREALEAVELSADAADDPFLLSKGHRKRLAVASVLAMRPRLLILDEPTTGLDYREQQRMMQLIGALHRRGVAVLMITHSPWIVAEYAERAVLMRGGEIIFDGSLRALFADEARLEAAHFRVPDITRLGNRLGISALSVDELAAAVDTAPAPQP
jgi:energy-coupling factor transport system ATP-binding protein